MRKKILFIFLIIILVSMSLFAWNIFRKVSVGTKLGDGATGPGCVQMSVEHKINFIDDNVEINFSYGHAYDQEPELEIISQYFVVYVIDGSQSANDPEDGSILYEHTYTGDDLLSDDYKCEPGYWIFSKVKYNNEFVIDVDFNQFDFDSGVIYIRFYETHIDQNDMDGEIQETEVTDYNGTQIYFVKIESSVQFSRRTF